MIDAFDADVLIYAAAGDHPLGRRVAALFAARHDGVAGIGSLLLLPELLPHPMRGRHGAELAYLRGLLARLDLRPLDRAVADLSVALGASYGLLAADAVHLATAVHHGAERFITNNRSDFGPDIAEIDVTYPDALPAP